jgi:hypothetical protein
MTKLDTWEHIAARQVRYRSFLRERMKALLLERMSSKDAHTVLALAKVIRRVQRHEKRLERHMTKAMAMLSPSKAFTEWLQFKRSSRP